MQLWFKLEIIGNFQKLSKKPLTFRLRSLGLLTDGPKISIGKCYVTLSNYHLQTSAT